MLSKAYDSVRWEESTVATISYSDAGFDTAILNQATFFCRHKRSISSKIVFLCTDKGIDLSCTKENEKANRINLAWKNFIHCI